MGEGMATYSSILAWRIPWTEETVGLQPIGSHRVGHGWSDLVHTPVCQTSQPFIFLVYFTLPVLCLVALCDLMHCSPPGSSVPGIFQARINTGVDLPVPSPRDWTHLLCVSCLGRRVLYHWATWEAIAKIRWDAKRKKMFPLLLFLPWAGLIYSVLSANTVVVKTLLYSLWYSLYLVSSQKFWISYSALKAFMSFKKSWKCSLI